MSTYTYQISLIGQAYTIRGTFFDAAGVEFAPGTVQLLMTTPSGVTTRYDNSGTVIGTYSGNGSVWEATFVATEPGYWRWQFSGTTAGSIAQSGAFDGRVFVRYGDGTL